MKQLKCILVLGTLFLAAIGSAAVLPQNLRCEYRVDPFGIDVVQPRLSWIVTAAERGERQTAYQILVASSPELLRKDKGDLWDSGKVASDANAQLVYSGKPLESRQGCFWKIRIWDAAGQCQGWSPVAQWRMGLLHPADWTAQWITGGAMTAAKSPLVIQKATYEGVDGQGPKDVTATLSERVKDNHLIVEVNNKNLGADPTPNVHKRLLVDYLWEGKPYHQVVKETEILALPEGVNALRYLRKPFALKSPVKQAVLYASALGLYEVHINGKRVGDQVLAPDWTDYRKRVQYQAYDVTSLVKSGNNALAALLANGWFSGHIGNGAFRFFGHTPAFLAQLEVTYADGSTERIVTDPSWRAHASPVLASDFMLGEDYDARKELSGWDQPGLDESQWLPVAVRDESARLLEAQVMAPVREICELKPQAVTEPKPGCWTFDLGQNMVGVVRLKITAPAGTEITLRHAEMLNTNGTIYTTNLRGAPSVDHYICKGGGAEVWQPKFTFHGFRYVELTGMTEKPGADAVTGVVLATDNPRTGEFRCSDPRINQLQSNIQWGQRGNYVSIPTDCPQRDERLGWMGDAQVFIRTASYNADVSAFFTKWLVDVDDGQTAAGSFGDVNPNTMNTDGVPAWGDAGVICPWTIYDVYGDRRILEQHLPAMKRWIDYLHTHSNELIRNRDRGNDYGDWLAIGAHTPKDLIGTAYFAYSTHLVARSCRALGRNEEADQYEKLFQDIKAAFINKYVAADGRIRGNTQCDYAMALKFDLLPEDLRARAAQYLEEDIQAKGNHLSTGFVGVSYLLPVLSQAGKTDMAYRLLLQDTFPSWLFSVKQGATTIWERWDGWTPEHGFQDPGMNSFNHYSLGSCGEYLFGGVAGIQPASPGFKTIRIAPDIGKGLVWAQAQYDSIQGRIASAWQVMGDQLNLDVVIPANTTATVWVPAASMADVTESGLPVGQAQGVKFLRQEAGKVLLAVDSGSYHFTSKSFTVQ